MPFCKAITSKGKNCKSHACFEFDKCFAHSDDCPICFDKIHRRCDANVLSCKHVFHSVCIRQWFETDHRCPCCRTEVRSPNICVAVDNSTNVIERGTISSIIQTFLNKNEHVRHIRLTFEGEYLYIQNLLTYDLIYSISL